MPWHRNVSVPALCAIAVLALCVVALVAPQRASAQAPTDPGVAKGVQLVNDGDYEAAIVTLDKAVRRLAGEPDKIKDLAQGYLYLGIAYVGKGHEAAAKAKFREAVAQMKDLSLSPDQFPPKVINLFEAAKEETRQAAQVAPAAAAPAPTVAPEIAKKKGGSKKLLLIGGGLIVAGGAAAAAGGGSKGGSAAPTPTPTPAPTHKTENRQAIFGRGDTYHHYTFGPGTAGRWKAEVTWTDGNKIIGLDIYRASDGNWVTEGHRTTPTTNAAEWDGVAGILYQVDVWTDDANVESGTLSYQLAVQIPIQ